jgi:hypothetical protein
MSSLNRELLTETSEREKCLNFAPFNGANEHGIYEQMEMAIGHVTSDAARSRMPCRKNAKKGQKEQGGQIIVG